VQKHISVRKYNEKRMKMLEEEFKVRGEERVMFEELRGSRMDDD
jgi:hypothetical protein